MNLKKIFYFSILPLTTLIVLIQNPDYLSKTNMPSEAILSGLLALVGFFFGARTFLVFKLQEMVYDNKDYQDWHRKLCNNLDLKQGLYEPLKNLDSELNHSVFICSFSTILLAIYIFLNLKIEINYIYGSFLLCFLFYNFLIILFVLCKIDQNIKYIIDFWASKHQESKTNELRNDASEKIS